LSQKFDSILTQMSHGESSQGFFSCYESALSRVINKIETPS
jgi:hypothetical protein